jgi:hypothetical protein
MKYGASSVMGTMVYSKFPTMGKKSMIFSPVADIKGILVVVETTASPLVLFVQLVHSPTRYQVV